MREVSTDEVERYVSGWADAPSLATCVRAWMGVKPSTETTPSDGMALPWKSEMTQAEWDEMVAGMKANADLYGRRRN